MFIPLTMIKIRSMLTYKGIELLGFQMASRWWTRRSYDDTKITTTGDRRVWDGEYRTSTRTGRGTSLARARDDCRRDRALRQGKMLVARNCPPERCHRMGECPSFTAASGCTD